MSEKHTEWVVDGQNIVPVLGQAVKFAENNPSNFGVLSVNTENPGKVLGNSITNNLNRWTNDQTPSPWIDEKPKKFVDFMQKRWAPIGAENDPDHLNENWAPNVRRYLKKKLGEQEYQKWQNLNLVKNKLFGNATA